MNAPERPANEILVELARKWMHNPSKRYPTSASIIKAISSKPKPLSPEESPEEVTAEDYDEWVYQALFDLLNKPQRFHVSPDDPSLIECPRKRLLRLGEEAEREGKPSNLFRYLMELTDNGSKLPPVTARAMSKAQKYLTIACEFKQFVSENGQRIKNFKDLKREFRAKRELMRIHISESTLERALREHDLDWSAYAIDAPRKGRRNKPASS